MCIVSLIMFVSVLFAFLQVKKLRKYAVSTKVTDCDFMYKLIIQALSLVIR